MLEKPTNKFSSTKKATILVLLFQLYLITLLLPIKVNNLAMFILCGFVLLSNYRFNIIENAKRHTYAVLIIAFYVMHVCALVYSHHFQTGLKELDKKVPMLLLPIIFLAAGHDFIISNRKKLLLTFAVSVYALCFGLLAWAGVRYADTRNSEVFYYLEFGSPLNFNPIYIAVYLLLAFAILVMNYHEKIFSFRTAITVMITAGFLVLLSSKSGLFLFTITCLYFIFTRIKPLSQKIILAGVFAVVIGVLIGTATTTRERILDLFDSEFKGIFDDDYTLNASTYTGATQRISFWKVSMKELANDKLLWFGVGTGAQDDYLNAAYKKYGLLDAGYVDFNLHNAYFEVVLEFGLLGLMLFGCWIFLVARKAVRARDELFMYLIVIFLIPALTESTLNVNKGIAFYSFMFSFFLIGTQGANGLAETTSKQTMN